MFNLDQQEAPGPQAVQNKLNRGMLDAIISCERDYYSISVGIRTEFCTELSLKAKNHCFKFNSATHIKLSFIREYIPPYIVIFIDCLQPSNIVMSVRDNVNGDDSIVIQNAVQVV